MIKMGAAATDRVNASTLVAGYVIAAVRSGDHLVSTSRKTDVLHVTVTGKTTVAAGEFQRQARYVIHTDQGDTLPVPGIQTFPLISLPGAVADLLCGCGQSMPAGAGDAAGTECAWCGTNIPRADTTDLGTLYRAYERALELMASKDTVPAARADVRARIETFRGRKLRAERGKEWGTVTGTINGEFAGSTSNGQRAEQLDRMIEQLRRDVAFADERRVTDPDAYPPVRYKGAPAALPTAVVLYVRHRAAEEAARRALECHNHDHVPGVMGCATASMDCDGIPSDVHTVKAEPIVAANTTGFGEMGLELHARLSRTLSDVGPMCAGETYWDSKPVRRVAVWETMIGAHLVIVASYEGRVYPSDRASYAAVLIDGRLIEGAGAVDMAQRSGELTAHLAWIIAEAVRKLDADSPAGESFAKGDPVTFVSRGVTLAGTVVRSKRDGLVTVDVPDSGDKPSGWFDVRPTSLYRPTGQAPTVEAPDPEGSDQGATGEAPAGEVDAMVRKIIAGATWSFGTGYIGGGKRRRGTRFTGPIMHPALPDRRLTRDEWTALAETVHALGGGRWMSDVKGFACQSADVGTPWTKATRSTRERVADYLADTSPAAVPAATAPAVEGNDQGAEGTPDSSALTAPAAVPGVAPAPAAPTIDGVPAGMPYVVNMPADWPTAPVRIEAKAIAKIMRTEFLPAWFAGVKFSARTESGSMYVGVSVRWTEGPADQVVSLVADMWRGKYFNGLDDSTDYRGPVLYVTADGTATAYDLPGVSISTHRDVTSAAIDAARAFIVDVPAETIAQHSGYVGPFGRPWYGGSVDDCARWLAGMGADQDTRDLRAAGPHPDACPVTSCALVAGHRWPGVHRTDFGSAFFAAMPDDGDQGGDGGEPTTPGPDVPPTPADVEAPAPEGFTSWPQLAAHIDGQRPALVDAADTGGQGAAPAPDRALFVINDGRGNIRVHDEVCADIPKELHAGGTGWAVTVPDLRGVVVDIYGNGDFEGFTPDAWRDYAGDVTALPCAGDLPDTAAPAAVAPAVAGDQGATWRTAPAEWFTCDGCGKATKDHSGGAMRTTDGARTLCRDCFAEQRAQIWDGRPSGVYGVAVNGELAGAVRHVQSEPHAFESDGADRAHCGAPHGSGKCGRLASSPIHQGGDGGEEPAGDPVDPSPADDQADDDADVPAVGYDSASPAVQSWRLLGAVTGTNTEARTRMFRAMRRVHGMPEMTERAEIMRDADALKSARDLDSRSWPGKCAAYLRTYAALLTEDDQPATMAAEPAPAPRWVDGKPKVGQLVTVPALNRTDGQRAEGVTLVAERVTALGCGCYRIESDRPGPYIEGGRQWVAVLTGCGFHERTVRTPEPFPSELLDARRRGSEWHADGVPVDALAAGAGRDLTVSTMLKRYPVGDGAQTIRDAFRQGYALTAEKFAGEAPALVEQAHALAESTQEIAGRNPSAQPMADLHAEQAAMCEREQEARTATAEQARALAYADEDGAEVERACRLTATDVSLRIALYLIWQLSAESGEVRYERLSLDESETAELAALVAALPSDEVRRVVTRLRLAKDRAKGYTWRGDHIPFRTLPEPGEPAAGTPVHVWQHGDVRHEITAVSVVGRTLYEIDGTNGYERMRPRFGAQIIARSSVAGRDPAYRVFWQLTGGGWHSATDDLPTAEFVSWNGCRTLDAISTPTDAVNAWLDRVMFAVTDDAEWDAAAPAVEARPEADQGDTPASPETSGSVAVAAPDGRMVKRPKVGAYIWTRGQVFEVVAVHGRGGEDIGVRAPDGERLSFCRNYRGHWLVVPAPAPAADSADTDDDAPADDNEPDSIYRLPVQAYTPELASDADAELTVRHDHEGGTVIEGSSRGDGVWEIAQAHGLECRRGVIFKRNSRDRFADLDMIGKLAGGLREAGHTVAVEVDDVWRPAAVREDARAERVSERAERLAGRASKKFGEANARYLAARNIGDGLPFGEPIKVGHHSERRHRRAFERIEANDRASYAARDYAEELARRADAAERNEASKQGGRAIMRRIDALKTDRRAWIRRLADTDKGTTGYARRCRLHIERLSEDIAFQVSKLGDMAASGAFVAWSAETVQRGDRVNVGGSWHVVARVSRKGVSVRELYQWHTRDDITPVTWDQIHGRRRDFLQLDTPNGQAWPIEEAAKVARWADLVSRYQTCTSYDSGDREEMRKRHAVCFAIRIVLGLDPMASAQEVAAFGRPDTVAGQRARALANLAVFNRLEAGERVPEVAASVTPIGDTVPAWRMPAGEPVDVLPADLVIGDIVAGVVDGFSTMRTVSTSIVGPVESAPVHENRRESGDWYHVTIDGERHEIRSSRWLKVHRAGTR